MSAAVGMLRRAVVSAMPDITVEGEISNLSRPASGHLYFSIKDDGAQLACVMWASDAARLRFRPEAGLTVRARGGMTVYVARGSVQLRVESMHPAGEGALAAALEALKRKLQAEGLFDDAHKKPIPKLPETIGVVTSKSGAAVRDVTSVLKSRYPLARVRIAPVTVQGDTASGQVSRAIRYFNQISAGNPERPDVLLVVRGGGSLEDLWAFNEEITVRAIHASGIPVITGVGHETDYTLGDLAADRRAATPSQAAELATPDARDLRRWILGNLDRQSRSLRGRITVARQVVDRVAGRRQGSPRYRLQSASQRIDELSNRFAAAAGGHRLRARTRVDALSAVWRLSDPLRPLRAGFALVESGGYVIHSADSAQRTAELTLRFNDGTIRASPVPESLNTFSEETPPAANGTANGESR